jgi:hypothetical protein
MTHNGRTHSHMVTVLPRPERHSTVIPQPVPPRWTRKKRTRKAMVPPFPQASDRSAHNSTRHNQGLFTAPLLGRKRHLTDHRSSPRAHEPDSAVLRTCSLWVFPALRTIQPDIPQRGPLLLHRRCCLRRPHQGQTLFLHHVSVRRRPLYTQPLSLKRVLEEGCLESAKLPLMRQTSLFCG